MPSCLQMAAKFGDSAMLAEGLAGGRIGCALDVGGGAGAGFGAGRGAGGRVVGGSVAAGATVSCGAGGVVVTGMGAVVVGSTAWGWRKAMGGPDWCGARDGRGDGPRRRGLDRGQDHEGERDQGDGPHQGRCAPHGQTAEQDAPARLGARHTLVVGIAHDPLKASPRVVLVAERVCCSIRGRVVPNHRAEPTKGTTGHSSTTGTSGTAGPQDRRTAGPQDRRTARHNRTNRRQEEKKTEGRGVVPTSGR